MRDIYDGMFCLLVLPPALDLTTVWILFFFFLLHFPLAALRCLCRSLLMLLLVLPDVNHKTQQTQWEPPTAASVSAPPPQNYGGNRGVVQATPVQAVPAAQNVQVVPQVRTSSYGTVSMHVRFMSTRRSVGQEYLS